MKAHRPKHTMFIYSSLEPRPSISDLSPKLRDKIQNGKPGFEASVTVLLSSCSGVVCDWVFQLASEQHRQRSSSVTETPERLQTSSSPRSGSSSIQEKYPNVLSEVNRVNSQDDCQCTFSARSHACKKNNKEEERGGLEDW